MALVVVASEVGAIIAQVVGWGTHGVVINLNGDES
jgi:hypothetical protein